MLVCRCCQTPLVHEFADLNQSPPSNSYLSEDHLDRSEAVYPLKVMVCTNCWLVQTLDFAKREELFASDYSYFSSYSDSWLEHCEAYVQDILCRLSLDHSSLVVEVASNDGYLLQYIMEKNVPCLGIEPTESTAAVSIQKGVPTICEFFGVELATSLVSNGVKADLMIANNVLAHVPDINDFLNGFFLLLKDDGIVTFEFPHLVELVKSNQFDTIYHEHYSYLSLIALSNALDRNGFEIFDVDKLNTHGGSLRVYVQKKKVHPHAITDKFRRCLQEEVDLGLDKIEYYLKFQDSIDSLKYQIIQFINKNKNKKIIGYGAAAKGNTLLNYCQINSSSISFVVDKNPHKQGKYLPGSRIPILSVESIAEFQPEIIIIFPWNLAKEISGQIDFVRNWGCKIITMVPSIKEL